MARLVEETSAGVQVTTGGGGVGLKENVGAGVGVVRLKEFDDHGEGPTALIALTLYV